MRISPLLYGIISRILPWFYIVIKHFLPFSCLVLSCLLLPFSSFFIISYPVVFYRITSFFSLSYPSLPFSHLSSPFPLSYLFSTSGRGFFTTPETTDRKALKLARKRILFNYTIRDENQEAIYGERERGLRSSSFCFNYHFHNYPNTSAQIFNDNKTKIKNSCHNSYYLYFLSWYFHILGFNSGLVVRVPTPSPHMPSDADWRALIFSLKGVEGRNAWLIREIVEVRNILLCYNIVILWFFWMFSQALLFLSSFWCFFFTFYRFFNLGYFSLRHMNFLNKCFII